MRAGEKAAGSFVFTKFPQFYGKNSRIRRMRRLYAELASHIKPHMTGSRSGLAVEYSDILNAYLVEPLEDENVHVRSVLLRNRLWRLYSDWTSIASHVMI